MASIHEASCTCGFGTSFTVGGTRQTFMKNGPFPFYCGNCGLISVNTRNERLACEKCNSENIHPYGVEATSLPSNEVLPAIQFFNYKAYSKGNICPSCKQMTLEFKSAGIRFC